MNAQPISVAFEQCRGTRTAPLPSLGIRKKIELHVKPIRSVCLCRRRPVNAQVAALIYDLPDVAREVDTVECLFERS